MNSNELSDRLAAVANFIIKYGEKPRRLADIGTDHAYLPCYLALNQEIEFAVAGDVVEGPFFSALNEVTAQNLNHSVSVRLGSGLDVIESEDQINVVAIAGMGGSLIRQILAEGLDRLSDSHLLVLQANIGEQIIREWLSQHNYCIVDEEIVYENNHYYQIIVAQPRADDFQSYTEREIYFGPIHLQSPTPIFIDKWKHELKIQQEILNSMEQSRQIDPQKLVRQRNKIKNIEEVIACQES